MADHETIPTHQEKTRKIGRTIRTMAAGALALAGILVPFRDSRNPSATLLQNEAYDQTIDDSFTIMTANVHLWKLRGVGNYERFEKVVQRHDPDVICMQEVLADKGQIGSLHDLGYNIYFYANSDDSIDGRYGNAVASKSQIMEPSAVVLPGLAMYGRSSRSAINLSINTPRGKLDITSTHLDKSSRSSDKQIMYIDSRLGDNMDFGCGDFNKSLSQLLNSALGSMAGRSKFFTFPSIKPIKQFDHIITSCGQLDGKVKLDDFGSDHLSVTKTFDISKCGETQ